MKAAIPAITQCRRPKKYRAHMHGTATIKKRTEPFDCCSTVRFFIEYATHLTTQSALPGILLLFNRNRLCPRIYLQRCDALLCLGAMAFALAKILLCPKRLYDLPALFCHTNDRVIVAELPKY